MPTVALAAMWIFTNQPNSFQWPTHVCRNLVNGCQLFLWLLLRQWLQLTQQCLQFWHLLSALQCRHVPGQRQIARLLVLRQFSSHHKFAAQLPHRQAPELFTAQATSACIEIELTPDTALLLFTT
jgi:hypothetical protein